MMEPLTERQQTILGLSVRTHIETGLPVASKNLVERFDLDLSPATVRHELAALDEAGYLVQLHTSAGRIPTEAGYRYFVQRLVGEFELPQEQQQMIRHQFHQARLDLDQWMRLAAAVLARASHGASIVTAPRPLQNRYRHLQLISTQGRLALLVLVLVGGEVKQQMLTLADPLPQSRLSEATERLNKLFDGLTQADIAARMSQITDQLEQEVARLTLDIVRRADGRAISDFHRDGLANIVDDEGARQAVRVLEERSLLSTVLNETLTPEMTGVQVVIGGEGRWEELKDCAIIVSRYGLEQQLAGVVAVVGPTRMSYGRNISAVRYVANLMSGFVYDYYMDLPRLARPPEIEL